MLMMTPANVGRVAVQGTKRLRGPRVKSVKYRTAGLAFVALMLLSALAPRIYAEELSGYSGAQLYGRFCASCHGPGAHGDGPVAASLRVLVPDLTLLANRHGGTFPAEQVRKIIDGRTVQPPHGPRDMPVWGTEFRVATSSAPDQRSSDNLIDRLVDYLRTIQH
jgi:mono/diheme cytochrome c family protein